MTILLYIIKCKLLNINGTHFFSYLYMNNIVECSMSLTCLLLYVTCSRSRAW